MKILFIFVILTNVLLSSYNNRDKSTDLKRINTLKSSLFKKGEYGYDLEFLKKYLNPVELVNSDSRLIIVPEYQGRVMTSSSSGLKGFSYGWINYKLIGSSTVQEHFNPYGGEERIWLGPEGGQFSLFFKNDTTFNLRNWYVPAPLDTEPFKVVSKDDKSITLNKNLQLENSSGTLFSAEITRKVTLLSRNKINESLHEIIDTSIHIVAYQSENQLRNTGSNCWNKENGALSIWMLSMLNPSSDVTVVLPYKPGDRGKVLYDYFGKIPDSRLRVSEHAVFFLADGKYRSKIGISPQRALPIIGSYDSKNNILTIIEFTMPDNISEYVNSALEIQKDPFSGDVINSYNDGPTEDGAQLGPFYELELSSPAAFLKPGEAIIHIQRIYHLEGSEVMLNELSKSLLNVSIAEIKAAFKN
jgi:hypothetical protein